MESIYRRCAGLDVHKRSVSASIRINETEETQKLTATFRTFITDLERLCQWLEEHGVRQVALESTGGFWIPVWNILERSEGGCFEFRVRGVLREDRRTDEREDEVGSGVE